MQNAPPRTILEFLTGRTDLEGQPLGARRELTRQRIVEAASALLLEQGYKKMRVDDVAVAAEVTRPTLYAYFDSKDRLFIAALAEEALTLLDGIAPLFDLARAPEERLRDWVRDAIRYVEFAPLTARIARDRDPDVLKVLLDHELARTALGMNPDLDKGRLFTNLIRESFPGTFTDDEANELASMMRALSHMAPVLLDEQARFGLSVERLADVFSCVIVDGMRARRDP